MLSWVGIAFFVLAFVSILVLDLVQETVCERTAFDQCDLASDFQFQIIKVATFVVLALIGGVTFKISKNGK